MRDDMPNEPRLPVDRITYRDGQLLTARDLRDDKRRDDRLRWLHTRYLHETWGIALGYEIQASKGDTSVVVGPGYAVDAEGRDLVLAQTISVPIPRVTSAVDLVLTLSYEKGSAFRKQRDQEVSCGVVDFNLRGEHPLLRWLALDEVRCGPQVPLARIAAINGTLLGELDFRVRRRARRQVRPHIGLGSTETGRTGWQPYQPPNLPVAAIQVKVDTSQAGFTSTPYYFALLRGKFDGLVASPPILGPAGKWPPGSIPGFFLSASSFIAEATNNSFTYRVLATNEVPVGFPLPAGGAESREWTITWLGVQPVEGCAPMLDLNALLPFLKLVSTFAEVNR